MLKDKQELITESIGYHETSDPLNSLFSRRCGNGSRLRVAGGKRCERGLEPSEARLTGVPGALLPTTTRHLRERLTGDLGSGGAGGEVYLHDIAGSEGAAAAGFYLAIDRHITGLDEYSCFGAVFYQVCELQKLS